MPVPPKRRSSSRKRRNWAHSALVATRFVRCSHCKKSILPHRVCPFCGYYEGRAIVKKKAVAKKNEKKSKT